LAARLPALLVRPSFCRPLHTRCMRPCGLLRSVHVPLIQDPIAVSVFFCFGRGLHRYEPIRVPGDKDVLTSRQRHELASREPDAELWPHILRRGAGDELRWAAENRRIKQCDRMLRAANQRHTGTGGSWLWH
jgi:hypothetical protein